MKHIGDITKIDGATIEPVDVITGGSPCQDLSVAGLRAGLAGERSGLFMDMVRVIKEMRDATAELHLRRSDEPIRPRWIVWENVYGAFSSNDGDDFRAVLEEFSRLADGSKIAIPRPTDGKWNTAGCIVSNRWSIAWRGMDACRWGVPQRRKRIALVVDLGGQTAQEILFERKGRAGDTQPRRSEGEETPGETGTGIEATSQRGASTVYDGTRRHDYQPLGEISETVQAHYGTEGGNTPIVLEGNGSRPSHFGDGYSESETMYTLNATKHHAVFDAYQHHGWRDSGQVGTLTAGQNDGVRGDTPLVLEETYQEKTGTLCAAIGRGTSRQIADQDQFVTPNGAVRRLTPLECERLQGFPDGWTDIPGASDAARYKALGNSIALPQWRFVLGNISKDLPKGATLGSLFDGIGGFPLVWEEIHGKGTARWASEIEKFPIMVTQYRFPEVVE